MCDMRNAPARAATSWFGGAAGTAWRARVPDRLKRWAQANGAWRVVRGSLASVVLVAALAAIMWPLRSHLSPATTALVLVVPVVVGVVLGGFPTGIVATVGGFLVYDWVFIPPYNTLSVGAAQNWVALGVYAVVMVLTARVVARLDAARAEAQLRAGELRRLFDLSELLVRESSAPELLDTIVTTVCQAFELEGAALLLPADGQLGLAASSGRPLSEDELDALRSNASGPVSSLAPTRPRSRGIQAVALSASGQAIGLLALRGLATTRRDHELLRAFANHLALALERAQLQEEAVRANLLEERDRLRRSLVGAVSHDLRTPLATIKVSTSSLLDPDAAFNDGEAKELLGLIDVQAGRLDRLVSNLLDMTRIQAGRLEVRTQPVSVLDLFEQACAVLGPSSELNRVGWRGVSELPLVNVDTVLVCQVLANLIDNALRYSPSDSPVIVSAAPGRAGTVEVSVSDRGPGVPSTERATIFELFNPRQAGGRGGLGLAIAHAFIEAHGQRIWVDSAAGHGARFVFTLPIAGTTAGSDS